ncbi:MAG: class I SAM-dependent DNA methyltransferase [Christensenellales bacterium]
MPAYDILAGQYDLLMDNVDYDAWAAYIKRILDRYGRQGGVKTVLEAACGTGQMTVRLSRFGYGVIALDISEAMLDRAGEVLRAAGVSAPLIRQDMRDISLHKKVDAVVCCCDGVNYLTGLDDVKKFFESAHELLEPGGLLTFDISSRDKLSSMDGALFSEDRPSVTYLWNNAWDEEKKTLTMDLIFFERRKDGLYTRGDERHVQRGHSAEEIKDLLEETGFDLVGVWRHLTEESPQKGVQRLQLAAVKR